MNDILAVIRGEPQAVRAFVHEYGPILRTVIRKMVFGGWREREEDLLQDLLLALFADGSRILRKWDPDKGRSLKTYLWVFAQKRTLDWLRRQHRDGREEPTEQRVLLHRIDAAVPEESGEPEWLQPLLHRFHTEFSQQDQRLVEMLFIQERSVREIAGSLGMTEDAVYQRRHRIKKRILQMKQELSEQQPPPTYVSAGKP